MNPARSVGGRLALALLVVVAGALAIVYVIVVPFYRQSLVDTRLSDLQHSLTTILAQPRSNDFLTDAWAADEAEPLANARVVVYRNVPPLTPAADSSGGSSTDVAGDVIAQRAFIRHGPMRGTVTRHGNTYAEAAAWVPAARVVVLVTSSLHNDTESVALVQRRVIIAGALATVFAIALGYALARLFARRIRRLEAAAERIAGGRFDQPVVDTGADELGQLASAFERMRLRLASLERARGEFIANASHELRTPLFSLGGFLELFAGEELDAETRVEFLDEMRGQVTRLTKLATDLLDLSRMDAGRLTIEAESFDLAGLGEAVAIEFGPRAAAVHHTLTVDVPEALPVLGDEERTLQIGRILLENALVHTPPGTRVELAATVTGDEARLSISDNGPGIPFEAHSQIFERFYRLDGTVASGSGLGLAIARELAELMGGRIELESGRGRTRFSLVLAVDSAARASGPELASLV